MSDPPPAYQYASSTYSTSSLPPYAHPSQANTNPSSLSPSQILTLSLDSETSAQASLEKLTWGRYEATGNGSPACFIGVKFEIHEPEVKSTLTAAQCTLNFSKRPRSSSGTEHGNGATHLRVLKHAPLMLRGPLVQKADGVATGAMQDAFMVGGKNEDAPRDSGTTSSAAPVDLWGSGRSLSTLRNSWTLNSISSSSTKSKGGEPCITWKVENDAKYHDRHLPKELRFGVVLLGCAGSASRSGHDEYDMEVEIEFKRRSLLDRMKKNAGDGKTRMTFRLEPRESDVILTEETLRSYVRIYVA